jgi:hypothetical protein
LRLLGLGGWLVILALAIRISTRIAVTGWSGRV